MDKLEKNGDSDYKDVLDQLIDKINEIIDWINQQ
tara:strand:+ start:6692 stop:6793 length:102 start_codon:yes stop_codon:yes gene_type:complete